MLQKGHVVRIPARTHGIGVVVAQELPTLLAGVRFVHPVLNLD